MIDLILTNYFTTKPDPQSGEYRPKDSLVLMGPWVDSVIRLGLQGIIFHDEPLSLDPINGAIRVLPYQPKTSWSVNDERFLCWLEYLQDHPEIDRVFLTDLFDVDFFRNPFGMIFPDYDLYLGVGAGFDKPIGGNKWLIKRFFDAYGKTHHPNERIVNAGVIGGKRDNVLKLISHMVDEFTKIDTDRNVNMAVFNKAVYDLFDKERLLIGPPLTSLFKRYEKSGNFAIRHK